MRCSCCVYIWNALSPLAVSSCPIFVLLFISFNHFFSTWYRFDFWFFVRSCHVIRMSFKCPKRNIDANQRKSETSSISLEKIEIVPKQMHRIENHMDPVSRQLSIDPSRFHQCRQHALENCECMAQPNIPISVLRNSCAAIDDCVRPGKVFFSKESQLNGARSGNIDARLERWHFSLIWHFVTRLVELYRRRRAEKSQFFA